MYFRVDEDGILICSICQKRLKSKPGRHEDRGLEGSDLIALIGKSAGAICRTLELPEIPPYQYVVKAAANIAYDQDHFMSAWHFVEQWLDGTTVWRSPDQAATAFVTPDGKVKIQDTDEYQ